MMNSVQYALVMIQLVCCSAVCAVLIISQRRCASPAGFRNSLLNWLLLVSCFVCIMKLATPHYRSHTGLIDAAASMAVCRHVFRHRRKRFSSSTRELA